MKNQRIILLIIYFHLIMAVLKFYQKEKKENLQNLVLV